MVSHLASVDYSAPLTADGLVAEVASGMFAFKNKIKPANIKLLWERLGMFISDTIRSQKGVMLPNLGSFKVGPVIGEAKKKIRPSFALLEGRYGSVSQERAKYMIGGRAPVLQPNYGVLSQGAVVHRAACQRLLAELLQRLGVHILSGRPIKTELPTVGILTTNRSGRFEFVFNSLLMEYFEREHYALIKEMAYTAEDYNIAKGAQDMNLNEQNSHRDLSAAAVRGKVHSTPTKSCLMALLRKCRESDRIGSGCVQRLSLEKWLQSDCRPVLARLDAATIMDLLDRHAYGKTSKQVMYRTLVKALEEMVAPSEAFGEQQQGHAAHHEECKNPDMYADGFEEDMEPDNQAMPVQQAPQNLPRNGAPPAFRVPLYGFQHEKDSEGAHQALSPQPYPPPEPHFPPPSPLQGAQAPQLPHSDYHSPPSPWYSMPASPAYVSPYYPPPTPPYFVPSPLSPEQQLQQYELQDPQLSGRPSRLVPPPVVPPTPSDVRPDEYLHYNQNAISPRSRAEYDQFNRMHFEKLYKSRGPAPKRAVTPKVGQEILNAEEYQAVKVSHPGASASDIFHRSPQQRPPYSHAPPYELHDPSPQVLHVNPYYSGGGASSPSQGGAAVSPQQGDWEPRGGRKPVGEAPGSARKYNILAPTPLASPPYQPRVAPVSQYDIAAEQDPARRARLREEYAAQCRQGWQQQIYEREAVKENLEEKAEKWPFAPTHVHDKRPVSATSKPCPSPRRSHTPLR